ncbi:hypothetical protein JK364_22390 [Streptomyces sp. 110]|uniref:Band 7 domain-containing protein n=1 Tax=Streptomyces endocoffeicus TaxID=2898945 RepID=A0ABS1PRT0_9ACTN|nr:DUF5819 family protein [Streptomyces endocoffeicus]MBL1115123.1 hypothetical protein [Streptomyces endocoffeicus]
MADTGGTGPGRSLPSLVVLAVTAAVLLGAACWHLATLFLAVTPDNPVRSRYAHLINGHVYPEFTQGWQLFAPEPLHENVVVEARVRTDRNSEKPRAGHWVNLTTQDVAAIRHNPVPSHAHQNMLRLAWDFYQNSHSRRNAPIGVRGILFGEYVKRIALQRIEGRRGGLDGERVVAVQVRVTARPVAPPRWSDRASSASVQSARHRTLPWWSVKDQDRRGL